MNAPFHRPTRAPEFNEETADAERSSITDILRALGALAIVGSGLIYMLQGLYHSQADLRNWVYIALIGTLGIGGIFSFRFMQDTKGARLFFALGTLLVPVQFSQLGGMVLNYVSGEQPYLALFQVATPAFATLISIGAISALVALLMSYAGFAVLNRGSAKSLCAAFLAMNLALLLPLRDLLSSLLLVAPIGGMVLMLEHRVFRGNPLFNTAEGLAARLICLLPLAIASTRGAFHFSEFFGVCLLLACASFVSAYTANCRAPAHQTAAQHWLRELMLLASCAAGLVALLGMSYELCGGPRAVWPLVEPLSHFAYALPVFAFTLYLSTQARAAAPIYRGIAIFALTLTALATAETSRAEPSVLLMAMSLTLAVFGFLRRQQISFAAGALVTLAAILDLLCAALRDLSINLWLVLALSGLFLVGLSSVLEKHGRRWLANGREYWQEFNQWSA